MLWDEEEDPDCFKAAGLQIKRIIDETFEDFWPTNGQKKSQKGKEMNKPEARLTVSERLHKKLLRLGYDVFAPRRVWVGRAMSSDLWRWEAAERDTSGVRLWGAAVSMSEALTFTDDHLRALIDHN